MDTYALNLRRNADALEAVNGYLKTLKETKVDNYKEALILGSKMAACGYLMDWLLTDSLAEPIELCEMLGSDMAYESDHALENGLISPSIVYKASAEAVENILYMLL